MAKSLTQQLTEAVVAGNAREVARIAAELTRRDDESGTYPNMGELMALPRALQSLPAETQTAMRGQITQNPAIVPAYAQKAVNTALAAMPATAPSGVRPSAAPVPPANIPNVRSSAGVPPAYSGSPKTGATVTPSGPKPGTIAGYIQSKAAPIDVRAAIIDRTSVQGLQPSALKNLEGAVNAAYAAGLSRIDITAGVGGGHLSHAKGTEIDIKGFNADGSLWTNAQRVAVAAGAQAAGADRFGIYQMTAGLGAGTLHIGTSGPGRPPSVWGAGGATSGPGSRQFTHPAEMAFLQGYLARAPVALTMLASLDRRISVAVGTVQRALAFGPPPVARPAVAAVNAVATGKPVPEAAKGKSVPSPRERPNLIGVQALVSEGGRIGRGQGRQSDGEVVKEVQKFLNAQGITDDKGQPLKEDGKAGRLTEQAIRNYQETHPELRIDGAVGPRTLAAMVQDQERTAVAERTGAGLGVAAGAAGLESDVTAYPGGVPAAAGSVVNYAMNAGQALAAWLSGGAPVASTDAGPNYNVFSPGYAQGYPVEPGNGFTSGLLPWAGIEGGLLPTGREGIAPMVPSGGFDMSPGFAQGYPEEPGTHWVHSFERGSVEMSFENGIWTPHDAPADALRLGSDSKLGAANSAAEFDSVYGAARGMAAAANLREMQDREVSGRFSETFAPLAFSAALTFLGGDGAFGNTSAARTFTPEGQEVLHTPSGWTTPDSADHTPSGYDPGTSSAPHTPSGDTGGGEGPSHTPGSSGGGEGPSHTPGPGPQDYSYADSIDFGGGIGHA